MITDTNELAVAMLDGELLTREEYHDLCCDIDYVPANRIPFTYSSRIDSHILGAIRGSLVIRLVSWEELSG
jgi:hypothetical protein